MHFRDRKDAGRQLASRLRHLKAEAPVVLGLPRGGVVVAAEVAATLEAPLDVLVVRKLGAPHQPELAIGAVTDGAHPQTVLNDEVVRVTGVDEAYLKHEIDAQLAEVERRQRLYRAGRPAAEVEGRTVIVVDDGIATGATVRAALVALRRRKPRRLVLAVPVGPPDSLIDLQGQVDDLVCLHAPPHFRAVGVFYERFDQSGDDEVIDLLERAARRRAG